VPFGPGFCPAHGIYAAWVQVAGQDGADNTGPWHKAACSIGMRPMFAVKEPLLEAHILDFNAEIYGQMLRVRPVAKLRDELRFDDLDLLTRQMEKDVEETRRILG